MIHSKVRSKPIRIPPDRANETVDLESLRPVLRVPPPAKAKPAKKAAKKK